MYIIPGEHNQAMLFGALLAYRIMYYLLPLVFSAIILFSYEGYLKYVKRQKLEKIKLFRLQEVAQQEKAG
jgi:hypothetical protein